MNTERLDWFKSRHCDGEGGQCLEVARPWHKSSYSTGEGGECIELSSCPHAVHVRDSKNLEEPSLTISPTPWSHFLTYATS
ncbi:DUF397 domain-containing protein [Streptomyces sp. NPDC046465]|uniref:DUF397 domain-containing protein n=1 Tax=Streptomyces sp. NPDC046465 TaxID=3155810 RepID=UPI0033F9384B